TIGSPGSNATIECPASPSFTAPTASDACGGSTVQDLGATTTAGTCANNYTSAKSWRAVDACGNTSGTVTQTSTVRETTRTTIGSPGANTTIACNDPLVFTPPTASDACGTSTVNQVSDSSTASGTTATYTRCWNAVDACSNTSATVCQTITRTLGSPSATLVADFAGAGMGGTPVTTANFTPKANTTYIVFAFSQLIVTSGATAGISGTIGGSPTFNDIGTGSASYTNPGGMGDTSSEFGRWFTTGASPGTNKTVSVTFNNNSNRAYLKVI